MRSKANKEAGLGNSWVDNHSRKTCWEKLREIEKRRKLHLNDQAASEQLNSIWDYGSQLMEKQTELFSQEDLMVLHLKEYFIFQKESGLPLNKIGHRFWLVE